MENKKVKKRKGRSKKEKNVSVYQQNAAIFQEEARELLAELEAVMLELENTPNDPDLVNRAFRAMHTIKGSGAMFGFDDIVTFTHNIESVYDLVREGQIKMTPELIALTFQAHDQIQKMLGNQDTETELAHSDREALTQAFQSFLSIETTENQVVEPTSEGTVRSGESDEKRTYRLRFSPAIDLFADGTNPILLLNELKEMGDCQITASTAKIPDLDEIDPESCYTNWDVILTTTHPLNFIEDVFIFIDDSSDVTIELIESDQAIETVATDKKIGEILVDRGDVDQKDLEEFLMSQEPIGEKLAAAGIASATQIQSALAEQKALRQLKESKKQRDMISSIRVPSNKLDKLVDLVGELVTGQARLTQIANASHNISLVSIAEEIERLTAELRDNTMSVRMLNFDSTFNKFKRLVRDLSHELSREVILKTAGGDTELDKKVIEQLNDPLVHIIRNSLDHGIESSEDRIAMGKPGEGTIELSASYSGAHVLIRVKDDGMGLDTDSIRSKAVERGLIAADAKLTDDEIHFLIFEAGFTTAKTVTNVSGRGVGMDVVKKSIEALRGSIDIKSVKGEGTSITLKLPLTLAIIDGLLINVGREHFVIPLSSVKECIELTREDIEARHGRHITSIRGKTIPYIRLREQYHIDGEAPEIEQIVITEIENRQIGFVVDHVIGQHQTVIKHLSEVYKKVDLISGATIMADGTVALILDINKHLQYVEKESLTEV